MVFVLFKLVLEHFRACEDHSALPVVLYLDSDILCVLALLAFRLSIVEYDNFLIEHIGQWNFIAIQRHFLVEFAKLFQAVLPPLVSR